MNNFKMNYAKKYHYMIKYFIMAFPLLLVISCVFFSNDSLITNINYFSSNLYDLINGNSFLSWYSDLLNLFNIQLVDNYLIFVQILPIWIITIYFFDLIIDVLVIIPRVIHRFTNRIGGDY